MHRHIDDYGIKMWENSLYPTLGSLYLVDYFRAEKYISLSSLPPPHFSTGMVFSLLYLAALAVPVSSIILQRGLSFLGAKLNIVISRLARQMLPKMQLPLVLNPMTTLSLVSYSDIFNTFNDAEISRFWDGGNGGSFQASINYTVGVFSANAYALLGWLQMDPTKSRSLKQEIITQMIP